MTELETRVQREARRAAHQAEWNKVPCWVCKTPIGYNCRYVPHAEMLADLAHAGRIQTAWQLWPPGWHGTKYVRKP